MSKAFLSGFCLGMAKEASMIKEAPFKSKAQQRFMFAAEARGDVPKGTARRWAKETKSFKKLPERVKKTKTAAAVVHVENLLRIARSVARKEVAHLADVGTAAAKKELEAREKKAGPEMIPAPPTGDESPEMPPSPEPPPPPPPPEEKKHRAHHGIRAIYIWARRRRECPPGKALDEDTGRCLPIKKRVSKKES